MGGGETQTHAERLKRARQLGKGRRALELEIAYFFRRGLRDGESGLLG
jgi:hypothetical protein